MLYSPLRYPGGKHRLSQSIADICSVNGINGHYIEPFAGGASVALKLLIENKFERITINDYDRAIYAFWYSVLHHSEALCQRILDTEVNMQTWHQQKAIYKTKASANLLSLGFATFFLNRTNRSGILNGGVIGGLEQKGSYKMDCRFNKAKLADRIRRIARLKHRIQVTHLEALSLIQMIQQDAHAQSVNTLVYFDPPYYAKGSTLYMNYFDDTQHQALAQAIQAMKNIPWIVSYDAKPEIQQLYHWVQPEQIKQFDLHHFAYKKRVGKEILFFSEGLKLKSGFDFKKVVSQKVEKAPEVAHCDFG